MSRQGLAGLSKGPREPLDQAFRTYLTERERAVTRLLAANPGIDNLGMAKLLGLRVGTVKVYLSRIFEKTGKTNRTALSIWAREELAKGKESAA